MTVWERLFGTPELTAKSLGYIDLIDVCDFMSNAYGKRSPERCDGCMYEYDRYGCERKEMTVLEWLNQELKANNQGDEDA